ncbi:MAG: HEAT repeat protein [Myxococcota bacterium]|jgi:HEAT repeat protein
MARRDALPAALAALSALDPGAPEAVGHLRSALKNRSSHVVARAAEIIGRARLEGFDAAMLSAMERFYQDPVRTDPSCAAKLALLRALDQLDHTDNKPFLRASAHIQLEPAWGPPVDTAASLRACAIRALGRSVNDESLMVLGTALADDTPPVRRAAIEAILHRGDAAGAALLSLRARFLDEDPIVRAECLAAMVRLAPEHGLRQLVPMLEGSDPVEQELAALALGESRNPDALQALIEWLDRSILSDQRAVGIVAIGAHRSEAARSFLLELVEEAGHTDAVQALTALVRQGVSESILVEAIADRPELEPALQSEINSL